VDGENAGHDSGFASLEAARQSFRAFAESQRHQGQRHQGAQAQGPAQAPKKKPRAPQSLKATPGVESVSLAWV
jgi:membrane protease subunit (stomatin/prohibitin family)